MTKIKILLLLILSLGLAACTQTPKSNIERKQSLKADYQSIVYNNVIKAANVKHISNHGGADNNQAVNLRLKRIVAKLVAKNPINGKKINAILLKSNSVNAYSLAAQSRFSYVYVTRGLINFVNNDAQLAAVLAHEIGHIKLGHHLARQNSSGSQFNKKQELAADKYSIKLLKDAGYNAQESVNLLARLDVLQSRQTLENQSDYPTNSARIRSLNLVIGSL